MNNNNTTDESAILLSNHFVDFLKSHDLISVHRLEAKLNIPKDTLRKAKAGKRHIPGKYFYDMALLLNDYGFNWPEVSEEPI